MGKKNYLIEGVSGTGKSSVCNELNQRGYHAIDGDAELAYQGDPNTGIATFGFTHEHHIWDIGKVKSIVAEQVHDATFFCGGSRNFKDFIDLFDKVFVLEIDTDTLNERLNSRPDNSWGKSQIERDLILNLHATKEDIPGNGIIIDAAQPLDTVVDKIIKLVENK